MRTRPFDLSPALFAAALLAFGSAASRAAEETRVGLAVQNDFLLGADGGGYSSGLFASTLRSAAPGEATVAPLWFFAPASHWLGLPNPTLAAALLAQIIVTPDDITRVVPDPTDAPYLGALMFRAAQVYAHGDVADLLALNLGLIGPASGAAQTQRLVHRLTGSQPPRGWATQVPNRLLMTVEGYRAWRFPFGAGGASGTGPAPLDLVLLGGGSLGSLQSSVGGSVLLRYGSGLERSLPTLLPINGRTSDPFAIGAGWFVFGGLSTDHFLHYAGVGSAAARNSAQLRKWQVATKAGVAYGAARWSITLSAESATPLVESANARQRYGSITYTQLLR